MLHLVQKVLNKCFPLMCNFKFQPVPSSGIHSGSSQGVLTQRTWMKTKLMIIRRLLREKSVKFVIKSSEQVGN